MEVTQELQDENELNPVADLLMLLDITREELERYKKESGIAELIKTESFKTLVPELKSKKIKNQMIFTALVETLKKNLYSEDEIQEFIDGIAEHSNLQKDYDILLNQYRRLHRKTIDRRRKYSKSELNEIKTVYKTQGNYSVRKTYTILKAMGISISERYLYKLCKNFNKTDSENLNR